ncbi:MAG: hypothetical protein K2P74_10580 [Nitrosomonas sp.]|nr:hypothetical protein [Nitrosomonas sp.]
MDAAFSGQPGALAPKPGRITARIVSRYVEILLAHLPQHKTNWPFQPFAVDNNSSTAHFNQFSISKGKRN